MIKYLVTTITANNSGNDIRRKLFSDCMQAREYYNTQVGELIQATVDDNNFSTEEKDEYISEIHQDVSANVYIASAVDPDYEWSVYFEQVVEEDLVIPSKTHMYQNSMDQQLQVKIKGGYLRAMPSTDPDYPGIWVELIRDNEKEEIISRPQILFEQPLGFGPGEARILIWEKGDEDYDSKIEFKLEENQKEN